MLQILDLQKDDTLIEKVSELLFDGFSDTGTEAWNSLDECRKDVLESLDEKKISRVAFGENEELLGWASGAPLYHNYTWELEVLVVDRENQRKGVGTGLLGDFEAEVELRGGLNVFLGTDDENYRTSIGGDELYPNPIERIRYLQNLGGHPFEFYKKRGYAIVGVLPDANGIGKPDIFMSKRLK